MYIEQIYTGCLAQGAYYIESNGEAAIIDPLRESEVYIRKAADRGATIKYILETHFHADFVSGHVDLARKTDAKIVFGPTAVAAFDFHSASHGEELPLGAVTLRVLHTPGHTMESTCYLLEDAAGEPHAVFTGDTLFIGDVGRPDLAQKAAHLTQEQLAATLYHSLRNHLMTLPADVLVYPAHGAGSACGKNLSSKTWDTIGGQLATNYALRADMTEAEFVAEVTDGLLPPPQYFPANVALNRADIPSVDTLLESGARPLSPEAFEAAVEGEDALVLDTRTADEFAAGHVPGAIFIGIDGGFAGRSAGPCRGSGHPPRPGRIRPHARIPRRGDVRLGGIGSGSGHTGADHRVCIRGTRPQRNGRAPRRPQTLRIRSRTPRNRPIPPAGLRERPHG